MKPHPEIAECFIIEPHDRSIISEALARVALDCQMHQEEYGQLIASISESDAEAMIEVKDIDARFVLGALIHDTEISGPQSPSAIMLASVASTAPSSHTNY